MYIALTLTDKIGQIDGFDAEAELDDFAYDMTTFDKEELQERRDEENEYGPPIVFAFVAETFDASDTNNYDYPFAIYLGGQRYDCTKHNNS